MIRLELYSKYSPKIPNKSFKGTARLISENRCISKPTIPTYLLS